MLNPPLPPTPTLDADGRLIDEVPCVACAYLLRGRRLDEACPECGEPVSVSVSSRLLRFGNLDWRLRLIRGCRLLVIAGVLAFIVGGTFVVQHPSQMRGQTGPVLGGVAIVCGVAAMLLFGFGISHLTSADKQMPADCLETRLGQWVRTAFLLGGVTFWMSAALHRSESLLPQVGLLTSFVFVLSIPTMLTCRASLIADRLPDAALSRWWRWLAGLCATWATVMYVSAVLVTIGQLHLYARPVYNVAVKCIPLLCMANMVILWRSGRALQRTTPKEPR